MDKPPPGWSEAIKFINIVRGPRTQEEVDFYVEQGVMTREEAEERRDRQLRTERYLGFKEARVEQAREAYRVRAKKPKRRIEDTREIRELYDEARRMKNDNPRLQVKHIAARLGIGERTLYTWGERFGPL